MYKLLILDDEPWVAIGICKLIPWEELGFSIIGTADNGIEGWALIQKHQPDLVISDIRMPGMDGLALLEKIRGEGLDTEVVMISGYAEFDYARQALRHGAADYLVKQIQRQDLLCVAERVRDTLNEKHADRHRLDDDLEDLSNLLWPEKGTTVQAWMRRKAFETEWPKYYYLRVHTGTRVPWNHWRVTGSDLEAMGIRTGKDSFVMIQGCGYGPDEVLSWLHGFARETCAQMDTSQIVAGISSPCDGGTPIYQMSVEADVATYSEQLFPTGGVRFYAAMDGALMKHMNLPAMQQWIRSHQREPLMIWMDQLKAACEAGQILLDALVDVYGAIERTYNRCLYNPSKTVERIRDFRQFAQDFVSGEDFFDMLMDLFQEVDSMQYAGDNQLVRAIMDEIDKAYCANISVQSIGRKYGISQGYLSNLIKRETGQTFTEHILERRIKAANELLLNTDKCIGDISGTVGYSDCFYFSKLYKKKVGMTPGMYRKTNKAIT